MKFLSTVEEFHFLKGDKWTQETGGLLAGSATIPTTGTLYEPLFHLNILTLENILNAALTSYLF